MPIDARSDNGRVCAPRARRPGRKQERCSRVCEGLAEWPVPIVSTSRERERRRISTDEVKNTARTCGGGTEFETLNALGDSQRHTHLLHRGSGEWVRDKRGL